MRRSIASAASAAGTPARERTGIRHPVSLQNRLAVRARTTITLSMTRDYNRENAIPVRSPMSHPADRHAEHINRFVQINEGR